MLSRDANEERAFPVTIGQTDEDLQGISVRDYFAARAPELPEETSVQKAAEMLGMSKDEYLSDVYRNFCRADAIVRYVWADAMMEARKR